MKANLLLFVQTLLVTSFCLQMNAQDIRLKGIGHDNRYDDGEKMVSTYVGWNSDLGKAIFIVDNGIYGMNYNGTTITTPEKDPAVDIAEVRGDTDKALWATNFNLMFGNSGAVYVDGQLVTVFSRDESSTVDEELFQVCKWNATTGELLSREIRPKSDHLESAGMAYNPKDGKVYGLFYLTGQDLPEDITSDPDYFEDEDADMTDGDAGYCLCTIDLATMKVTPVTPGLYYYNFITFAINSDGRAFALTSGGASGVVDNDGKMRNIDGNLVGAQLWEFDLTTGLIKTNAVEKVDVDGEAYTDFEPLVPATGYCSQYKRQAACFAMSNPDKMYWVGYYNSGKGINEWGSWATLSDKEWRANGKYDTALYEIDVNTGETRQVGKINNRWIFSALWIEGDDTSDGAGIDVNPEPSTQAFIALSTSESGAILQQVEKGSQYTYKLEPAIGWQVHSVTFNNEDITGQVTEAGMITTPVIENDYSTLFVTFEQDSPDALQDIRKSSDGIRVLGRTGGVSVRNAKAGDMLYVYTTDGQLLQSQRLNSSQTEVALESKALYIIKVADKVVKVRL